MLYTCPSCGFKTLERKPPGTFEVCPICFWEDDNVQFDDPDYVGGANSISLREAQKNFIKFGVSDKKFIKNVRRPTRADIKDPAWNLVK